MSYQIPEGQIRTRYTNDALANLNEIILSVKNVRDLIYTSDMLDRMGRDDWEDVEAQLRWMHQSLSRTAEKCLTVANLAASLEAER